MASIANLKVAEVGNLLEQAFVRRYGEEEYQRLFRTIDLLSQENTTRQEDQVIGILTLLGRTTTKMNVFLALLWLSKKEMTDPIAQAMLDEVRQRTVVQVFFQARRAVRVVDQPDV